MHQYGSPPTKAWFDWFYQREENEKAKWTFAVPVPFGWRLLQAVKERVLSDPDATEDKKNLAEKAGVCDLDRLAPGVLTYMNANVTNFLRSNLKKKYGTDMGVEATVRHRSWDIDLLVSIDTGLGNDAAFKEFLTLLCKGLGDPANYPAFLALPAPR